MLSTNPFIQFSDVLSVNIWLFSHGFMNIVILVKIWNFNLKAVPW